jgi:hypothetical protein
LEEALEGGDVPFWNSSPANAARPANAVAAAPVQFKPGAWRSRDLLGILSGRFQFNANGTFTGRTVVTGTGVSQDLSGAWTYVVATGTLTMASDGTMSVYQVESLGTSLRATHMMDGVVFLMTPE